MDKSKIETNALKLLLAGIGTYAMYIVITRLLIPMPFWKYIIIELLLVFMHILYTFTTRNLNNKS